MDKGFDLSQLVNRAKAEMAVARRTAQAFFECRDDNDQAEQYSIGECIAEADYEEAGRLIAEVWRDMGYPVEEGKGIPLPEYQKAREGALARLLVIRDAQDEIIGTAGYRRLENGDVLLEKFYVHPDKQGKGIGKQALREVIKQLEEKEFNGDLVLDTNRRTVDNQHTNPSYIMYRRLGFREYRQEPVKDWPDTKKHSDPNRVFMRAPLGKVKQTLDGDDWLSKIRGRLQLS